MSHVRRLLVFLKPYRMLAVLSLLTLGVLAALELSIPRLIERIIDDGVAKNDQALVIQTAVLMLALSASSALIALANNSLSIRAGEGMARDLREAIFLKIQTLSFGNLDRRNTGQLIVRLTSDVNAIKQLAQITLRVGTRAPLMMIGSLLLMFATDASLALTLIPILLIAALIIAFFVVRMEPLFLTVQERLDRLNSVLQENIAGVRVVKAFVRADFESARFETANDDLAGRAIRVMRFMSSMTPLLTMCVNIGIVLVIWTGGLRAIEGRLSLGQIIAFTNYLLTTLQPLVLMTMLSTVWAAGIASAARIDEVLDATPELQDAPDAATLPADADARVAFDAVSFRYNAERPELVLRDVCLNAEPGQTIAILGATGVGKSTLVNLIPRFYDATTGAVTVGGRDVKTVTQGSLHAAVAIAPQESILFTGTVRDNIRYGRPDAPDDAVIAAAKAAQAHEFISKLSEGYDARIEQRGANLSGGQKQRIAIARALLMRPRILILDDSTSAVDVETETKIQNALESTRTERIMFIVAQRISTVLKADKIIVLDQGRVVAQGDHRELLSNSPVYQEIYASQLGGGPADEAIELANVKTAVRA
jgi:ATP-binding cassette, subfamily B, multidrug efflux pump